MPETQAAMDSPTKVLPNVAERRTGILDLLYFVRTSSSDMPLFLISLPDTATDCTKE
jgi:hypothetical protein